MFPSVQLKTGVHGSNEKMPRYVTIAAVDDKLFSQCDFLNDPDTLPVSSLTDGYARLNESVHGFFSTWRRMFEDVCD